MNTDERAFTFNDISLIPRYSELERGEVDIKSTFFNYKMDIPVISSPMDTITGIKMMLAMKEGGGLGVHHRYCSNQQLEGAILHGAIAVSPAMGIKFIESLLKITPHPVCVLDVAHGDTVRNYEFCVEMLNLGVNVVSGNIATPAAAERYALIGVKTFRVGIGSGSVCSTRVVTGVGVPQATAINEIYHCMGNGFTIISDGGHKTTGDIVKALALGADFVILGGMLAGTDESEGMKLAPISNTTPIYRGMASAEALSARKKEFFVEGVSKRVEPKGPVGNVLKEIKDAIEVACYYLGVKNLKELKYNTTFIKVSENSYLEGLPSQ